MRIESRSIIMRWALTPLALAAMSFCSAAAHSATIRSDIIDNTPVISITGAIEAADSQRFKSLASLQEAAVVFLDSPGGATLAAIEIGETIRLKGFKTAVLNGDQCVSACALIWLAGTPRFLERSARVGFHATYTSGASGKVESGVGNAIVGRYFTLLNLPVQAIIFATSAPPDSLNWLDANNYKSVGIEASILTGNNQSKPIPVSPPQITTVRIEPPKAESSETSVLWRTVGTWSVFTDPTLNDSCFLLNSFSDGTFFRIGHDQKYGTGNYVILGNAGWTSLREDQTFELTVTFSKNTPWRFPTRVMVLGTDKMLYGSFSDEAVWQEFATSSTVVIQRSGRQVAKLNLAGTREALAQLTACRTARNARWRPKDPFAD